MSDEMYKQVKNKAVETRINSLMSGHDAVIFVVPSITKELADKYREVFYDFSIFNSTKHLLVIATHDMMIGEVIDDMKKMLSEDFGKYEAYFKDSKNGSVYKLNTDNRTVSESTETVNAILGF